MHPLRIPRAVTSDGANSIRVGEDHAPVEVLPLPGEPSADARAQEALRLVEAFLAIEDAAARGALITLAEGLVSHDWARRLQRR